MTDLLQRQREHLFFTWTHQARPDLGRLEIVDAKGAKFQIADGRWMWDLESQVYNVTVGHKDPRVQRRMIAQIESLPACAPHAVLPVRADLGEALAEITGLHRAFLTCGGSEAVENAIKIARLYTGRGKVITRKNCYHGATQTVLGLIGDPRREPFDRWLPEPLHIRDDFPARAPTAERASCWLESFHALLEREGPDTIAAVLLEGLTGTNGMQTPPEDFWPGVREACDQHGILLIDDEIFAGFGRTGRWFATEHWGVRPDLMTIGKGMTSGCAPLAGVMVSAEIAARFEDDPLTCGLTHYAHPVSCAAALATIEVIREDGLVAQSERVGTHLASRLDGMVRASDGAIGRRGRGLMQGLELAGPAAPVVERLWDAGVFAPSRGSMLFVCPPLCIDEGGIDEVCDRIAAALGTG
jgi:taurine--2-oxoglutarate transaminase